MFARRPSIPLALLLCAPALGSTEDPVRGEPEPPPALEDERFSLDLPAPEFSGSLRARGEAWTVPHDTADRQARHSFAHLRTRLGVDWSLHASFRVGAEVQDLRVFSVPDRAPRGPGINYFRATSERNSEHLGFRQLYAEYSDESLRLRAGRLVFRDGVGPRHGDPVFRKVQDRGRERLVGARQWPGGGRTEDGVSVVHETDRLLLRAFGGEINKHAFAIEETGHSLDDHRVAGLDLFVPRGVLIPQTELRAFGIDIRDGRSIVESSLGDAIAILSYGVQLATQVECGDGHWDGFVWMAWQSGDYGALSHRSAAFVVETGYRFSRVAGAPWIRIGHARAQGDDDPQDGRNRRFYNGVPSNHPYYGLMDMFAFSNVRNSYAELSVTPRAGWTLAVAGHHFALANSADVSVVGAGAADDDSFGYGFLSAQGARDLGWEVDLSANLRLEELRSDLQMGYGRFFPSTGFDRAFSSADASFAWLQWTVSF